MDWKKIVKQIRFLFQYVPFTMNFVLVGIGVLWLLWQIRNAQAEDDAPSSFIPFLNLMSKTALLLLLAIVVFSFCSALFSYLYFLWLSRNKSLNLVLSFDSKDNSSKIRFQTLMEKVRRPLLGAVRTRLVYDDGMLAPKLTLLGNFYEKGKFFRKGIGGKQALELPDIKSYQLRGGFFYFEDMLHLFSFAGFLKQQGHFAQNPRLGRADIEEMYPQYVVREDVHVDESKPIPGDYVNYKTFERGDDIRRIVWKIYAKSGDLVVRIPENRDFYASHLNFYTSFNNTFPSLQTNNAFGSEMLNYYKNCAWTTVDSLLKKEIPIGFVPDQKIETGEGLSMEKQIQQALSNSFWQKENNLLSYLSGSKSGVICISSFNDSNDLEELLNNAGKDTIVYLVRLSAAFRNFLPWSWVKRIFVQAPEDRLKKIRSRWIFNPLRYKVIKNEKALLEVLKQSEIRFGVID